MNGLFWRLIISKILNLISIFGANLLRQNCEKIFNFANKNNVQIIADCPFYVGFDSVDCYFNKEVFELDENNYPSLVSGCPLTPFLILTTMGNASI